MALSAALFSLRAMRSESLSLVVARASLWLLWQVIALLHFRQFWQPRDVKR